MSFDDLRSDIAAEIASLDIVMREIEELQHDISQDAGVSNRNRAAAMSFLFQMYNRQNVPIVL
jgi:hypothetical protein